MYFYLHLISEFAFVINSVLFPKALLPNVLNDHSMAFSRITNQNVNVYALEKSNAFHAFN